MITDLIVSIDSNGTITSNKTLSTDITTFITNYYNTNIKDKSSKITRVSTFYPSIFKKTHNIIMNLI